MGEGVESKYIRCKRRMNPGAAAAVYLESGRGGAMYIGEPSGRMVGLPYRNS